MKGKQRTRGGTSKRIKRSDGTPPRIQLVDLLTELDWATRERQAVEECLREAEKEVYRVRDLLLFYALGIE